MELVFEGVDHAALTAATKRLGAPAAERPRLVLSFWDQQERKSAERARALAAGIEGAVTQTHNLVLVDDIVRKHRVAIRGHREGASVTSLDGEIVVVHARLWREVSAPTKGRKAPDPVPLDAVVMEAELRARLRHELGPKTFDLEECVPESWSGRVRVRIRTSSPSDVLRALAGHADSNGLEVRLWVFDIDPLQRRIRRLLRDVDEAERVRPRVGG
jgi:hypothetical protein